MKQLIQVTTAFFILFAGFKANAQEIQFKAGLNYSSITYFNNGNNRSEEFSPKLGYQFGANLVLPVSTRYSVNVGAMMVSRKNDRLTIPEPDEKWHFKTTRWYLEFPVLMRREFRINEVNLYSELGPYVGVGVGRTIDNPYKYYYKGEFEREGNLDYEWGKEDYDLKRLDFGYNVGFGLRIGKLEFGINYEHGLIDFENASWLESKNRAIIFNCAYTLFSKQQN